MAPLLRADNVSKHFAGVQALQRVSFELRAGEIHALVGENGAGKSTLIKIITGAVQPDAGLVEVMGRIVEKNDPVTSRSLGVAVIHQQPALFLDLTAAENIALGLEKPSGWRRVDWRYRRRRAGELLERVGAAFGPDALARDLSMPEQQLVEIARALGAEARVLILDEPTASLSEREVERLFRMIRDLRGRGVGMIYISHRLEELFQVADRVTVLRDGQVVATHAMADVNPASLIRLMVGRELTAVFPKQDAARGDIVLELRGVGSRAASVSNISFHVRAGEILGLAGLVGAGRTELARILFGLHPADAGEIRLCGQRVIVRSPAHAVELGIAYVPEDRRQHGVLLDMAVAPNITLAILRQIAARGWIDGARERQLGKDFVQRLGIKTPSIDAAVGSLSGGNQQKVALARWLAAEPAVLILDEPTQGVDVGAKAEIHRLISELAGRGLAIVMISSELPEIIGMSDRIAVMHGGGLVDVVERSDATQEKLLSLALGHGEPNGVRRRLGDVVAARNGTGSLRSSALLTRETWVTLAYAALLLLLAVFAPTFFQGDKFRSILVTSAPMLVAAVGMALVILTRHIDISIGSQFSVCAVAAGLMAQAGTPMPAVALFTMALGAGLGAVNGFLVARWQLPSIVVTLATMVIIRDGLRWWREGESVKNLPASFQWLGLGQEAGQWLILGVALAVLLGMAWALRHLAAGRAVYATGSDPDAAFLIGIRPSRVVFAVFVLMGALSGLAALLNAIRFADVDASGGLGMELEVITAVVVGGVAVSGGRGTLFGPLVGVLLLGTIGSALVFLGAEAYWAKAIQGIIILVAVASDALKRKRIAKS
jgi:rhamnose transport system ATP-binding protein